MAHGCSMLRAGRRQNGIVRLCIVGSLRRGLDLPTQCTAESVDPGGEEGPRVHAVK